MNLVSVVIPAYNRENTIAESVKSVLNQTFTNIEVIVVDDHSTDKTWNILNTIKDNRLRAVLLEENHGACYARNKGVELACGDFIAFQDSDDVWYPEKLEKQLEAMEREKADICFCRAKRVALNGLTDLLPQIDESRHVSKQELQNRSLVSTQMMIGKAQCFKSNQFDVDMPRLQDYDLVIRLAEQYNFYYISEPLVEIRLQSNSISMDPRKKVIASTMILEKYSDILQENTVMKCEILQTILSGRGLLGENDLNTAKKLYNTKKNYKNMLKVVACQIKVYSIISRIHYRKFTL